MDWIAGNSLYKYNDPTDSSNIDIIVSILRRFSNERKETVKQALRDVLKESLPFFIEEEARGRFSNRSETLAFPILGMLV
jgi:hypothetical protein